MKTLEAEAISRNNDSSDRFCVYLERFVCWLLISFIIAFTLTIMYELRESMRLHNYAFRKTLVMDNMLELAHKKHMHPQNVQYFMP